MNKDNNNNYCGINVFDEATFKADMRKMYRAVGFKASMRCLFEILKSAEFLAQIINEEKRREASNDTNKR